MIWEKEDNWFLRVLKKFIKVWKEVSMKKEENGMEEIIGEGENNKRECLGMFYDEIRWKVERKKRCVGGNCKK